MTLVRGLVFDIDGVLVRGEHALPGAVDALNALARDGYRLAYLSNDSASSSRACAARLARHGFPITEATALTAAVVAARFARRELAGKRVLLVGMPAMVEAFESAGVHLVGLAQADAAEAFIMGRDESFTYEKLVTLMNVARRLGSFFATGLDARLPVHDGQFVPGAGAMITAVAYSSGVEPIVLGKPSAIAAREVADALGLPPTEVAMVGDSPTQDIAMGVAAGMHTVLVLTGSTSAEQVAELAPPERPDAVLATVASLPEYLARAQRGRERREWRRQRD